MNFENYNKIYQEILDIEDDSDISANYLLNKYEIKNDTELLSILHQIKKNEYVSSQNTLINRLIKELDYSEEMIDVNEIVDIKENIIDKSYSENEKNKEVKAEDIINTSKINTFRKDFINKKKFEKYLIYSIPILLLVVIFIITTKENTEDKNLNNLEISKNKEIIEKEVEKTIDDVKNIVDNTKETISEPIKIAELNTLESGNKTENTTEIDNEIKKENVEIEEVVSFQDISAHILESSYLDGKLIYNDKAYSEGDDFLGYKIYKLTPIYVKLEDEENEIRKQFIFKK